MVRAPGVIMSKGDLRSDKNIMTAGISFYPVPVTPGNVVRSNQKLCKWNPYGSSLTALQIVIKQVNAPWILHFCQFSQIDILKSGNVVPNSFHFYDR